MAIFAVIVGIPFGIIGLQEKGGASLGGELILIGVAIDYKVLKYAK